MNFDQLKIESDVENGEVSEKTKEIFLITDKISSLLKDNNFESWVIGGLAVDAYAGKTMREHSDADFWVWQKDGEKIAAILQKFFDIEMGRRNKNGEFILFIPRQLAAGNKKNEESRGNILWLRRG
jgi:hypothetical protein